MDRIRITVISLLAGTALLGATAVCAQGRGQSAVEHRGQSAPNLKKLNWAQPVQVSPAARASKQAEKDVWLQRLVGQFRATSIVNTKQSVKLAGSLPLATFTTVPSYTSDFSSSNVPMGFSTMGFSTTVLPHLNAPSSPNIGGASSLTMTHQKVGRVECQATGGSGAELSCVMEFVLQANADYVMTGPPSKERTEFLLTRSEPSMADGEFKMGKIPDQMDWSTKMAWVSLEGDTATFRMACAAPVPRKVGPSDPLWCRKQVRITAEPGSRHVQMSIDLVYGLQGGEDYSTGQQIDLLRQLPERG